MHRTFVGTVALASLLACTGPKGDPGLEGPPGPPGTFSGTFDGGVTFNGNVNVNGNVTAENMLAVEAFTAWLTNSADFTSSASTLPTKLKYTDIRQNSAPSVFRMELDGSLTVLKPGVVTLTASYDALAPSGVSYATLEAKVNATRLAFSLSPGGSWAENIINIRWKANANDAFSFLAIPAEIGNMDNGAFSVLTAQWVGVP